MGEPAGIGPDIILLSYARRAELGLPPFIVFGNAEFLARRAARLGLDLLVTETVPEDAAEVFGSALPVFQLEGAVADQPGEIDPGSAPVVIGAIAQAVDAVKAGCCRAIVTAPINKAALYSAGFSHPGHTEYLAALCAENGVEPLPVMMLAHEDLRTVPLTIHVPLRAVPEMISGELIRDTLRIMARDLQERFGIVRPRIAVAGLNPHAGEDGTIGREDADVIAPAIAAAQSDGIDAVGPLPGDTLFYPPHWRGYDAVLAMYHDQALIPIKTVAFDAGVNVTLGLPIVRTSPDHGTAFSLAGTGKASIRSFVAAIAMADRMSADTA